MFQIMIKMQIFLKWTFIFLTAFTVSEVQSENSETITPVELKKLYDSGEYAQLGNLLGIHPDLIKPGAKDPVPDEEMLKYGFEQGDILLSPAQKLQQEKGDKYTISQFNKWKTTEIPYTIIEDSYNSTDLNEVISIIQHFNNEVPIVRFRPWKPFDTDYVVFYNGNRFYSNLGCIGGLQSISVPPPPAYLNVFVLHAMMHTLGFIHELNRPDRNDYIRVQYNNIPKAWRSGYHHVNPSGFQYLGPYDYYSIMHTIASPEIDGKKPYKVLDPNIDASRVGRPPELTDIDKNKVKTLYGKWSF